MTGLALERVTKAFGGVVAVDSVDFLVAPGEVVCLLGPSGCGKSTTLRLAAGLEAADSGTIRINGAVVDGGGVFMAPEERRVGLVFQDYALFPHLSVEDNVAFGLPRRPGRAERARELLARVNLAERAADHPHRLSGGEQQRVALARALAPKPAVMLLDEPFSGLNFRLRDRIGEELLAVLRGSGTATLMVTHDSDEAMRLADRIVVMQTGRVVQAGTPTELYDHPISPFVAEFFGEINMFKAISHAGVVETPAGLLGAPRNSEGHPMAIAVRPESVRLGTAPGGMATEADVLSVHPMGAYVLVKLKRPGSDAKYLMRVEHGSAPQAMSRVLVWLDPRGCFVFPA